jgi:DNA primase
MPGDDPGRWDYTLQGKRKLEELSKAKIILDK